MSMRKFSSDLLRVLRGLLLLGVVIVPLLGIIWAVADTQGYFRWELPGKLWSEYRARNTLDSYLSGAKRGDLTWKQEYDVNKSGFQFVNILAYAYLTTRLQEKVEHTITIDRTWYDREKDRGKTYAQFLAYWEDVFGEKASRSGDKLIINTDDWSYQHWFLYDMEITNRLGHKLFKKYVFVLEPTFSSYAEPYKITAIVEK